MAKIDVVVIIAHHLNRVSSSLHQLDDISMRWISLAIVLTFEYGSDNGSLIITNDLLLDFAAVFSFHFSNGSFFKCELEDWVDVIWILAEASKAVMRLIQ